MDPGHLARLLHAPQLLHQAFGGDELVGGERLRERPLLRPRDRVRFETDARRPVERPRQRLALRSDRGAHLDDGVDAGALPSCSADWVR